MNDASFDNKILDERRKIVTEKSINMGKEEEKNRERETERNQRSKSVPSINH